MPVVIPGGWCPSCIQILGTDAQASHCVINWLVTWSPGTLSIVCSFSHEQDEWTSGGKWILLLSLFT